MTNDLQRSYSEANIELEESFGRYMVARNWAKGTIREYEDSVRRLRHQLVERSFVETDRSDIRNFMCASLKRGVTDATVNKQTFGLRAFFKFMLLGGLIQRNPMQAISYRKLKRRLPRVLSVEEVEAIIATGRNPWERACVEVLYATGVRVNELVNIRLESIIFPERMILIENGKGGKDRWVLYGQRAAEAIAEYQEWRPSVAGYLFEAPAREAGFKVVRHVWEVSFYTPDGKLRRISLGRGSAHRLPTEEAAREYFRRLVAEMPEQHRPVLHPQRPYSTRAIHNLVVGMGRRAGVKGVHPHSFRRAMACHMLANGAGIRNVQELLGHKLLSTTQIYTTLTDEKLQEIHKQYHPMRRLKMNDIVRQGVEIDYKAMIAQMVEDRIAEILADKKAEDFRPFFEISAVSVELRRRQTVAERKKWAMHYEKWGCMICEKTDRPHHTLGMCQRCFSNRQTRLMAVRRDLMAETEAPPEIGFKDGVKLARKALMPSIGKLARKRRLKQGPAFPPSTTEP